MTSRITLADFIAQHPIKLTTTEISHRPGPHEDGNWHIDARHYRCTLSYQGRRMQVVFSMGPALTGKPTLASLLSCLASDASSFENAPCFGDWAADYGYDTDSRKAERTYKQVERQAKALLRLLSYDTYEQLLWQTEQE